ncbi:MAG TPA: hypothetical protein VFR68_09085 [Candidatus Dormibacteraeota bacterium]|nr:hypothetical protein [Candidatus Dormibacteraeota bacterium]
MHTLHSPKAVDVFLVAEQFRTAAAFAINIPVIAWSIPVPELYDARGLYLPTAYMACKAFSLELYFKCLLRMGRKPIERGHDLEELFSRIGQRHQAKIRQFWNDNSDQVVSDLHNAYKDSGRPIPKIDFAFALSISKDAFSIMRYVYEGVPPDKGWAGDTIVEGARNRILEIHPEWERLRQIYPAPSISFQPPHA